MKPALQHNSTGLTPYDTYDALLDQDIWQTQAIGIKPDRVHASYYFNFTRLKPTWFKQAVKRFVRYQAATKSRASCQSYITGLTHFGLFLSDYDPSIKPNQINRAIIVQYIAYLARSTLGTVSRAMALVHLRTFHWIMVQEKGLPWPSEPLILSRDIPRHHEVIPRFIPEAVIDQLLRHLPTLPPYWQHLITLLLETGRRIGEICTLPVNCLAQDAQGDYFLTVTETKFKKSYLIPISARCLAAIQAQQQQVKQSGVDQPYLFPSPRYRYSKTPHVSARQVNAVLNKLAQDYDINDQTGVLWHFHTHQFRHTVGTRMINAGVPQAIVQRYLGHESPEMTARYAYIQDTTLKTAFNQYQGKLVDIHGSLRPLDNTYEEAKWLQYNIMAQALPNGLCGLPLLQQRCPHANACLTCAHFRTHEQFLPQHLAQLETTNTLIATAKKNGWQRQWEMNVKVKHQLEAIIASLQPGTTDDNSSQ